MADTTATPPDQAAPPPARKRPPPRPAQVKSIAPLTPKMLEVVFEGEGLAGFGPAKPSAHIKILFDKPPYAWTPASEGPRPPSRTYTPRRFDPATNELTVEFALHGDGLASNWVQQAKSGDPVWIGGPGAGFEPAADLSHIVLICDDTALPAAAMIVDALPEGCAVDLFCEVEDAAEKRAIGSLPVERVNWVLRNVGASGPGLEAAFRAHSAPDDALWWIACEAAAMRAMRKSLFKDKGVAPTKAITRGYWRAGESNHPDHDYGED